MAKIEAALALFNTALAAHGEKLSQNAARQKEAKEALIGLEKTCAHLRTDVSSLKKQLAAQMQSSQKAGKQIEAAIGQIDAVLGADAPVNEKASETTGETTDAINQDSQQMAETLAHGEGNQS